MSTNANLIGLMRQAAAERRSLRLELEAAGSQIGRVVLVNGYVAWATCGEQRRVMGAFLLRVGHITRAQLKSATAIHQAHRGTKQLGTVMEEQGLMTRATLRRCLLLHVRGAIRTLLSHPDARVTAIEITTPADESLLLRLDEVLPAWARSLPATVPLPPAEPSPRGVANGHAQPQAYGQSHYQANGQGHPRASEAARPALDGAPCEVASERPVESADPPREAPSAEPHPVAPEPTPELKAELAPEPKAEPTPEPKAEPTPEPKAELTPEPKAELTPEPNVELTGERARELTLKGALQALAMTQGINAAVVVGRDGFVIDSAHAQDGLDTGAIGAVISAGLGTAEVMGGQLEVGGMTSGMFEYDGGIIIMSLAGEAILAVLADAEANLGMVRHQFKKRCSEVARAI